MHLISIRNLRHETANYPDVSQPIEDWYAVGASRICKNVRYDPNMSFPRKRESRKNLSALQKRDAPYAVVKKAKWENLEDVRKIYRDAEAVGEFTIFNIKGNRYRSIGRN